MNKQTQRKQPQALKDILAKYRDQEPNYLTEEEEQEYLAQKELTEEATAEFIKEQKDIEAAYDRLSKSQRELQILLWEAGLMREWQTQMRYQTLTDIDRRNNYLR